MPLAFDSKSHGVIAFGFFNIDSDMLLLDRLFFFAGDFCNLIIAFAEYVGPLPYETSWKVYTISHPEKIGDLMGAIHGVRFTGFIGDVYRRFPFPDRPKDFKQKQEGYRTRDLMRQMIAPYAKTAEIPFSVDQTGDEIAVGPYRFTRHVFHDLIRYVWEGGYPRWRDRVRPEDVTGMAEAIRQSSAEIWRGLDLTP